LGKLAILADCGIKYQTPQNEMQIGRSNRVIYVQLNGAGIALLELACGQFLLRKWSIGS